MIRVEHLSAAYGARKVLHDITFSVKRGEICAILGGSGCGKSTLLKHIMRLLNPTSGAVIVDGSDITTAAGEELLAARRKMGVLFQSGALFGSMSLAENIALPLREYTRLPPNLVDALVRFKLAQVGLAGFEGYMPAELSGGMRKRAALARAMALDPQILLFDEMSAGLDPVTSAELDQLVRQINRALGLTILVVTHELPSIMAIADHVIMLEDGKMIAEGTPVLLVNSDVPAVHAFFNRTTRRAAEQARGREV
ncbi:ATP-binding cassette domain-containing protein [bacterium]|nr:ATP-binding cassette domain-containing protein [candidate division CSSED10-310 bacterium]